MLWNEIARLSIRITSVIGRNHVDDFLPLIDFVKESPGTNAVAPGWRLPILQSLDIGAVMWVVSQLGVETKGSGVNFGLGEKKGSRRIKGSGVFSKPRKEENNGVGSHSLAKKRRSSFNDWQDMSEAAIKCATVSPGARMNLTWSVR